MKKGGLSYDQYLAALSKKADEVRNAGICVEDEELALFSLDGLDSLYDTFVTVITAMTGDLTFSVFKGLLKAHEQCVLRESPLPPPSANFVQNNQYQRNVGSSAAGPSVPPPSDTSGIIYQICNKKGHTTIICFNRHNETRFPTPNNQDRRGNYRRSRSSYGRIITANAGWYADLGCTNHTTNNADNLVVKDNTKKEVGLTIANGSEH